MSDSNDIQTSSAQAAKGAGETLPAVDMTEVECGFEEQTAAAQAGAARGKDLECVAVEDMPISAPPAGATRPASHRAQTAVKYVHTAIQATRFIPGVGLIASAADEGLTVAGLVKGHHYKQAMNEAFVGAASTAAQMGGYLAGDGARELTRMAIVKLEGQEGAPEKSNTRVAVETIWTAVKIAREERRDMKLAIDTRPPVAPVFAGAAAPAPVSTEMEAAAALQIQTVSPVGQPRLP